MSRREEQRLRTLLAVEAARIIREEGMADYGQAKRKARDRLGLNDAVALPKNTEVEEQLMEAQRLFGGRDHERLLTELREAASHSMRLLEEFRPRLVGAVLAGTATEYTPVQLHLFAENAEEVAFALLDHGLRYTSLERKMRPRSGERLVAYPGFAFRLGEVDFEATVFPEHGLRQAPLSPIDGKPMRRASLRELEELLPEAAVGGR